MQCNYIDNFQKSILLHLNLLFIVSILSHIICYHKFNSSIFSDKLQTLFLILIFFFTKIVSKVQPDLGELMFRILIPDKNLKSCPSKKIAMDLVESRQADSFEYMNLEIILFFFLYKRTKYKVHYILHKACPGYIY